MQGVRFSGTPLRRMHIRHFPGVNSGMFFTICLTIVCVCLHVNIKPCRPCCQGEPDARQDCRGAPHQRNPRTDFSTGAPLAVHRRVRLCPRPQEQTLRHRESTGCRSLRVTDEYSVQVKSFLFACFIYLLYLRTTKICRKRQKLVLYAHCARIVS